MKFIGLSCGNEKKRISLILPSKTGSCWFFFHSYMHMRIDLFDKIIANRCICLFAVVFLHSKNTYLKPAKII